MPEDPIRPAHEIAKTLKDKADALDKMAESGYENLPGFNKTHFLEAIKKTRLTATVMLRVNYWVSNNYTRYNPLFEYTFKDVRAPLHEFNKAVDERNDHDEAWIPNKIDALYESVVSAEKQLNFQTVGIPRLNRNFFGITKGSTTEKVLYGLAAGSIIIGAGLIVAAASLFFPASIPVLATGLATIAAKTGISIGAMGISSAAIGGIATLSGLITTGIQKRFKPPTNEQHAAKEQEPSPTETESDSDGEDTQQSFGPFFPPEQSQVVQSVTTKGLSPGRD